ncbi:MAG: Phage integrase [Sporomusa sp.]|jgi:integrase|nr:Phage integrase [Sporomusa sp.]
MARQKKRADGRYQAKVHTGYDENGEATYKFVYAKSTAELETKKDEVRKLKGIIDYQDLTVSEWLDEWIEILESEDELRESSIQEYETLSRLHIKPILGQIKLHDLTPQNIRKMLKTKKDAGLSQRRVQYIYVTLNAAIKQAIMDGKLIANPCTAVKKPTLEQSDRPVISDKDFKRLTVETKKSASHALFELAWDTGMRLGELLGLPWQNINFKTRVITVSQQVKRTKKLGTHITKQLKSTKAYRDIPVTKEIIAILKEHRRQQEAHKKNFGIHYQSKYDLVFPKLDGSPKEPSDISNYFKDVIRRLGLPETLHFHDIRHTHATTLAELGIHPKAMQVRLGHATSAFTMDRYTHNTAKMQQGIAAKLSKRRTEKKREIKKLPSSQKVVNTRRTIKK